MPSGCQSDIITYNMAERIVEVGVPPSARQEVVKYIKSRDPIVRDLISSDTEIVKEFLVTGGYIRYGDNVLVSFVPDPAINPDSPVRPITVTKAVVDTAGNFCKIGDPLHKLEVRTVAGRLS